jgi:hypothetical protein
VKGPTDSLIVKTGMVKPDLILITHPPGDTPELFAPGIVSVDNKNSHALAVSPDGKTIIFSRYPDRTSYILSFKNGQWSGPAESFFFGKEVSFSMDGTWIDPKNLGETVNSGADAILCPTVTPDGKFLFFTKLNFNTNTGTIYWVSAGLIDSLRHTETGFKGQKNIKPKNIDLFQNYPNPFNTTTKIRYLLKEKALVRLAIYDPIGQKIKTLINSFHEVGEYTMAWDATDDQHRPVGSGVYYYALEAESMYYKKKMVFIR